jgi:hypothetical protein
METISSFDSMPQRYLKRRVLLVDCVFDLFPTVLVHAVNSKSVCKSKYSLELKRAHPGYFNDYKRRVLRGMILNGSSLRFPLSELFGIQTIYELCCRESWKEPFSRITFLHELALLFQELKLHQGSEVIQVGLPSFESWSIEDMVKDLEVTLDKFQVQNIDLLVQSDASNAL